MALNTAGHGGGILDDLRAKKLAFGRKNPDTLSRFCFGRLREIRKDGLDGARVMEYGAGFLMAEPLIYSLFKARSIDAVDYYSILRKRVLKDYVLKHNWENALGYSTQFYGKEWTENWYRNLMSSVRTNTSNWWENLGIRYLAPYDVLRDKSQNKYDMILSSSTLEHVPPQEAQPITKALAEKLDEGGVMYHYIHLEDHRDMQNNPFAFLSAQSDYRENDFDIRGNRLRISDWKRIFHTLDGFEVREYPHEIRKDVHLPSKIDNAFSDYSEEDLKSSHYTVQVTKISN